MAAGSIQPEAQQIVDVDNAHRLMQTSGWIFHHKGCADLMVIEED
jgi:hypothetical protein